MLDIGPLNIIERSNSAVKTQAIVCRWYNMYALFHKYSEIIIDLNYPLKRYQHEFARDESFSVFTAAIHVCRIKNFV